MQPTKTLFVCDLKADQHVESLFLVEDKILGRTRRGERYIKLRLGDRSGSLEGRLWNGAPGLDVDFEVGDIIAVQARAELWRERLQLNVAMVWRTAADQITMDPFVPTSRFERPAMVEQLRGMLADRVRSRPLRSLLLGMLADSELCQALERSTASRRYHHNYIGGLLEHTVSMVRLAAAIGDHYDRYYPGMINNDLLLAGVVCHDLGKIVELSAKPGFAYTEEGELLGHVVSGIGFIDTWVARMHDFPADLALKLKHMVASHHGRLEYGAPVRPKLIEAVLLHQIDMIDSRVGAFHCLIQESPLSENHHWSSYSNVFSSKMMLPPSSGWPWSPPNSLEENELEGPGVCWWDYRRP